MLVSRFFVALLCAIAFLPGEVRADQCPGESQATQVVVEARLLSLPSATAEAFMAIAALREQDGLCEPGVSDIAFLTQRQVDGWISIFQADKAVDIRQLPKITGDNGQELEVTVGDHIAIPTLATDSEGNVVDGQIQQFVGVHAKFLPVVSADQRFVKLNIDWSIASLDGCPSPKACFQETKLTKTVVLPSGGTAVCLLKTERCAIHTARVVLTKIPYLNRHCGKASCNKKEECLFLMVTTRIIASE
jgi:type II secretory pathway component GspD/PulD (secretin)